MTDDTTETEKRGWVYQNQWYQLDVVKTCSSKVHIWFSLLNFCSDACRDIVWIHIWAAVFEPNDKGSLFSKFYFFLARYVSLFVEDGKILPIHGCIWTIWYASVLAITNSVIFLLFNTNLLFGNMVLLLQLRRAGNATNQAGWNPVYCQIMYHIVYIWRSN